MAALTVKSVTAVGVDPAPVQLSAWATPDTIPASEIGKGVVALVANGTAGSLDLRVGDTGVTPAGNAPANPYRVVAVPAGESRLVYIGPANVDATVNAVEVGASAADAAFTVAVLRY